MPVSQRVIVITGASSGIGAALAEHYAGAGAMLGLLGRDMLKLEAVAALCRRKGAHVEAASVDVCDSVGMSEWLGEFDTIHPIDMLISNAGISGGSGGGGETEEQVRRIFAVNVNGMLNTVLPIIPRMQRRGRGQIALMASLAGMRGLPSAPAYSASKAAVKHYGEALRGQLAAGGIKVSVICPGYIRTPLTDKNTFYMPFLMEPEQAVKRIADGLAKNRSRIAFPRRLYWPLWLLSCLSPRLTDPLFAALPKKP